MNEKTRSPLLMLEATRKATIKNLIANKFFSNCIYANQGTSFKILDSKFSHSLSSAVSYNAKNINSSFYNTTLFLFDDSLVKDCFFSYCFSDKKGGAIQAAPDTIKLDVISCSFIHCLAQLYGGGIFIMANSFSVVGCCFHNCTAYSYGQAFNVEGSAKPNVEVNDTIAFRCSTREKRRNAAAYQVESCISMIRYNNHTRCVSIKSAAAMTAYIGEVYITRGNVVNCSSMNIFELMYLDTVIQFKFVNFIANRVSTTSPVIIVSRNITIDNCYIEGNTVPFVDCTPGPPSKIIISNCFYDSLGMKESTEYETRGCKNIGANDNTFIASPKGKNYCFYLGEKKYNIFQGVKPIILVLVSFAIIFTHISLIHPSFFTDAFSTLISGDTNSRARRRKAAIRSNRID